VAQKQLGKKTAEQIGGLFASSISDKTFPKQFFIFGLFSFDPASWSRSPARFAVVG
jgi:hypothetical protein